MLRSGSRGVALLLASLLALCCLAAAREEWQPTPLPLSDSPEVQPPRALLDQTASVTLTGAVAEVVRALAEAAGRDRVVSAPSDYSSPAKEFRAQNVPLWQAMDKLLETFRYDWVSTRASSRAGPLPDRYGTVTLYRGTTYSAWLLAQLQA